MKKYFYALLVSFFILSCKSHIPINGKKKLQFSSNCGLVEISCKTHRYARFDLKITSKESSVVINPSKIRIMAKPSNGLIDNVIWKYNGKIIDDTIEVEMGKSLSFDFRDYSIWDDNIKNNTNPQIFIIVEPTAVVCDGTSIRIDTLKINLKN